MAAITRVYTIARAAAILGIAEELLDCIAFKLEPGKDGVLWIWDNTEDGTRGFTDFGLENVREILDDPPTLACFLD